MAGLSAREKTKKIKIQSPPSSSSSWADLIDDIICLILNRLHYVDQIRFRAVCKGWREANIEGVKSADKLPWMVAIDSHSCYLFDPSHKRKYTIETSITSSGIFINSSVVASKHGWILFAMRETDTRLSCSLFFYTPFSNETIQVPKFHRDCSAATFTTSPVSSDCEIFVVNGCDKQIYIGIYRLGDRRWYEFSFPTDKDCTSFDRVYMDGVLYTTFFEQSAVGAFNSASKEWKIYPYPLHKDHVIYGGGRLIDVNGNLMLAGYGDNRYSAEKYWAVFRLELSQMKWDEVEKWDNGSLFMDCTSLFIPLEEGSELRNTIHWYQCYTIGRNNHSRCPKLSKIYDTDITGSSKFWIQHPQLR